MQDISLELQTLVRQTYSDIANTHVSSLSTLLAQHSPEEEQEIIHTLSTLAVEEVETLFSLLVAKGLFRTPLPDDNNEKRQKIRQAHLISVITKHADSYLAKLPKNGKFADIGCGTGTITLGVLKKITETGGHIYGADILNYLTPDAASHINFTKQDALSYLHNIPNNYFDGSMEVVMLHHLPSKQAYAACLREMIRVTKPAGPIIIMETTHATWEEHFTNALLDILLNNRTSAALSKKGEKPIPVPVNFLSRSEITTELENNGAHIDHEIILQPSHEDQKFHTLFIGTKY